MIKILQLGSTVEYTGEPRVTLMSDAMVKTASNDIRKYWDSMDHKPDKAYLHVLAMTAIGWYSCNNNGDAFTEEDLVKYHPVFVEQANLFMHHMNKDPKKSMGQVLFSFYNHDMHRVELVIEVDKDKAPPVVSAINAGEPIAVSMGVRVKFDKCSVCGNEAKTRAEYCDHLKYNMKKILPDGRQIYAINPGPLKFFDISIVKKPADRTAWALQKAASDMEETMTEKCSAELGEEYEATQEKLAALKKMSEIIKEIDAIPVKTTDGKDNPDKTFTLHRHLKNNNIDFDFPQVPFSELNESKDDPGALLSNMVGSGVFPTLQEAAFIVGKQYLGDDLEEHHLPMMVKSIGPGVKMLERNPDIMDHLVSGIISNALSACQSPEGMKITINIEPVVKSRRALLMQFVDKDVEKTAADRLRALPKSQYLPVNTTGGTPLERVRAGAAPVFTTSGPPASEQFTVTGTDGNKYRTTRGAARSAANSENVVDTTRGLTSAGLALAAFAATMSNEALATKWIAAPVLAAMAVGMYPRKRDTVETDQGVEVPVSTFFSQVKEAAIDPTLIAPALGAMVPAAVGLDYVYNSKVKNRKDPYYRGRMGMIGQKIDKAGQFISEHPMASVAAGAVLGAAGKARLAGILKKKS